MYLYDSVLFDFDGVIMDSEPVHFDCWRAVLEPLGVNVDWDRYGSQCIGISDYAMLEMLGAQSRPPVSADRLWQEYGRKNQLFVARVVDDPPVPAATHSLIEELAASPLKLGIVSSSASAEVETILKASGLREHFEVVICGDHVNHFKPHPEPYELAAQYLCVKNPLVVEDSDSGEASGRAAGFTVARIDHADNTARIVRQLLITDIMSTL